MDSEYVARQKQQEEERNKIAQNNYFAVLEEKQRLEKRHKDSIIEAKWRRDSILQEEKNLAHLSNYKEYNFIKNEYIYLKEKAFSNAKHVAVIRFCSYVKPDYLKSTTDYTFVTVDNFSGYIEASALVKSLYEIDSDSKVLQKAKQEYYVNITAIGDNYTDTPVIINSNSSTSVQCSGKTKSGERCKRTTTDPSGRCHDHR